MSLDFLAFANDFVTLTALKKILLFWSVFLGVFYFHRRGRALGFSRDKLLDLSLLPLAASFLFYNLPLPIDKIRLSAALLLFLFSLSYLTKSFGWSYARIIDLTAEAVSLSLTFFPSGLFLVNIIFLLLFLLFQKIRVYSPRTGLVFYIFLPVFSTIFTIAELVEQKQLSVSAIFLLSLTALGLVRLKKDGYTYELLRLTSQIFFWASTTQNLVVRAKAFITKFRRGKLGAGLCEKCGQKMSERGLGVLSESRLCDACSERF